MERKKDSTEYSLYKLGQNAKKIWVVVLIGLCLTALNSLIIISTSIPIIKGLYISTLGEKSDLIQKLESLVPATNVLSFKQKFGEPTFININDEKKLKEYVFVNKYFYLSVTTDINDKVIYYAVTTRDSNFNPIFSSPIYDVKGNQIKVSLGKTRFNEISDSPLVVDGCVGAHDWFYYESYYLGNPGNYQTYAFGINMSGDGSEQIGENINQIADTTCSWNAKTKNTKEQTPILSEKVDNFRKNNFVNTYLVTAPYEDFVPQRLGIGVDYYQVRILD